MAARALILLLAVILAIPISEATQPVAAKKKAKAKTIARTFSDDGAIDIPDFTVADPYQSTLRVDAFKTFKKAKIKDVDLTLRGFSHTRPDDVEVFLVAPNGRNALLMSDRGGQPDVVDLTLTFDDQATEPISESGPLISGRFQPRNTGGGDEFPGPAPEPSGNDTLAAFNNGSPHGTWRLFILDDSGAGGGGDGGIADGWQLKITARVKDKKT